MRARLEKYVEAGGGGGGGLYFIMASPAVLAATPGLNALHKLAHNLTECQ